MTVLLRKLRGLEALLLMLFWVAAIKILPIRRILPDDRQPAADSGVAATSGDVVIKVRAAVRAAMGRLPFKPSCLAQSLAAATMLRLRRVPHRLHIGVRDQGAFEAHAWVDAAGVVVAGEGSVGDYSVMLSREN